MRADKSSWAEQRPKSIRYARFHVPIIFSGVLNGVHQDTSKLSEADISFFNEIGIRIKFKGRTCVVGWANIQWLETEP